MKLVLRLLDFVSKLGSYILIFSLLFLIQKYTLGYLFNLREIVLFNIVYLYEILFSVTSILFIKKFVKVSSPYEKYLSKC